MVSFALLAKLKDQSDGIDPEIQNRQFHIIFRYIDQMHIRQSCYYETDNCGSNAQYYEKQNTRRCICPDFFLITGPVKLCNNDA